MHLDMSNVNKVDAIGLSIFIAQVHQIFFDREFQLIVTEPKNKKVAEELKILKFQDLLSALGILSDAHRDLFSLSYESDQNDGKTGKIRNDFNKIIHILPSSADKRTGEISRIKSEVKEFFRHDLDEKFSHQQVMIILVELVKNTLDHSGKAALLALKMTLSGNGSKHFSFTYSDTGDGICHSVRRHMASLAGVATTADTEINSGRVKRLAAKGSFADLLQWALKPGNSTKHGNGVNLGLGLMLIVEASKHSNIRLTLKDADTSMVLTELLSQVHGDTAPYSHALIRQLGVKTCASPMLIFHGEIDIEVNNGT